MLLPAEFSVAYIGDATAGLTLILPRDHYDEPILVTCASGSPYAIFLGQNKFAGFECTNNNSFGGILIPNVSIEINEDSIFDAENCQRRSKSRPARRSKSRPVARGCADMQRGPIGPLCMSAAENCSGANGR